MRATRPALFLAPLALLVPAAAGLWSAQEPAFDVQPVAGRVSVLTGAGGNIGLCLTADGLVVVDDQLASARDGVLAAIAAVSPEPPRFLVNTHWHGDHTGNNEPYGSQGVPIVAHEAVRARLAGGPDVEGKKGEDTPRRALPSVTFRDSVELYSGDERIEIRHIGPAHTDGDSAVWFHTSKVLHAGDVFFNGLFPFVDLDSGGSVTGYVESVKALVDSIDPSWKVIPGHGPVGDYDDLVRYRDGLADCVERVRGALAEGQGVEDMLASNLLADYESWSWRFISTEAFLTTLVRDLGD